MKNQFRNTFANKHDIDRFLSILYIFHGIHILNIQCVAENSLF